MRKIILNVDDDTEILCVTTISDKETHKNVNATAFDVRDRGTDEITMPECIPYSCN